MGTFSCYEQSTTVLFFFWRVGRVRSHISQTTVAPVACGSYGHVIISRGSFGSFPLATTIGLGELQQTLLVRYF
jgi:hypothetical protein